MDINQPSLYELADTMAERYRKDLILMYNKLKERSKTYGILRDEIDIFADDLEIHQDAQYAQTVKMDLLELYKEEINRLKIK